MTARIKRDKHSLTRIAPAEGKDEGMGISFFDLDRSNLHSSEEDITNRDWNSLLSMPEPSSQGLDVLLKNLRDDIGTGNLRTPSRKRLEGLSRPIMMIEFGFGTSTYQILDWCIKHDGYLITVDMPIAPQKLVDSDKYGDLYWWGVDRYHVKYKHCLALRNHPIAKKRWFWVNDDCFKVTKKICEDDAYRKKLFYNGIVDYVFEDAVHDKEYCQDFWDDIKPYMSPEGIFYGYAVGAPLE